MRATHHKGAAVKTKYSLTAGQFIAAGLAIALAAAAQVAAILSPFAN